MTRPFQPDGLISPDFDFSSFVVNHIRYGDHYSMVNVESIGDIFVEGEASGMSLKSKYNALQHARGFIHVKEGLSLEIEDQRIKSLHLKEKYIGQICWMTARDIETVLGPPDQRLRDGVTWVADFVEEAEVMVYDKLKLYVHVDAETGVVIEIKFGDVDKKGYEI